MSFAELAAPATSYGKRQAALLVHALAPSDRDWLVAQLSHLDQADMGTLLGELTALGIPSDPRLLQQALSGRSATPAVSVERNARQPVELPPPRAESGDAGQASQQSDREFLRQLDAPGIAALATILLREPATLTARCLRVQVWPWQQAVLAHLNPVQRTRVQDAMDKPAPMASQRELTNSLLRHLRRRCEQVRDNAVQSPETAMPIQGKPRFGGVGWVGQWYGRLRKVLT